MIAPRLFSSALLGLSLALSALSAVPVSAQTAQNDFESGLLSPFSVEVGGGNVSVVAPPAVFPARSGALVHRMEWSADNYVGTRLTRGVEGMSASLPRIRSTGWYAFSFRLPADFPAKNVILAQLICWTSALPATDKTLAFFLDDDGRFRAAAYHGSGGPATRTANGTLTSSLALGVWHDVVVHATFANNSAGSLRVWLNGAPESSPTFQVSGIRFGNGAWTNSSTLSAGAYAKWGLYCWDVDDYTDGETRTVEFDDVAYLVGNPSGAFDLVKSPRYGATTLVAETYDAVALGSTPPGWSVSNSANTSTTVATSPSGPGRVLRASDTNPSGLTFATRTFPAQTGPLVVSWRFYQNGTGNTHRMLLRSGSTNAFELFTINGNLVCTRPDGGSIVLGPIPAHTWHEIVVAADPAIDRATVALNGTVVIASAEFRNAVASLDRFAIGTSNASNGVSLHLDDLLIETDSETPSGLVAALLTAPESLPGLLRHALAVGDGDTDGQPTRATLPITLLEHEDASLLAVTYARLKRAAALGVGYHVEWTPTLAAPAWSGAGITETTVATGPSADTVLASLPLAHASSFLRLRLALP